MIVTVSHGLNAVVYLLLLLLVLLCFGGSGCRGREFRRVIALLLFIR